MNYLLILISIIGLGTLSAAEQGFAGLWDTNWGRLKIVEKDGKLVGAYKGKFEGEIAGKVKEKAFHYQWRQPNGEWGSGVFRLSKDGQELKGTWGSAKSETNGGVWTGRRMKEGEGDEVKKAE
ncbi:MAG: hypothetical protein ACQKBY_01925 [Verrucomicrobiales bacterium]